MNIPKISGEKAELIRATDDLRRQVQRLDLQAASLNCDLDILTDPPTRITQMADTAGPSKATAKVYWDDVKKTGRMVVSNLAPVPQGQGKCLELWVFCADWASRIARTATYPGVVHFWRPALAIVHG